MIKKINKYKYGFTLIEVIFYISLFAIFSIAIIDTLMTMTKSFKETAINSDIVKGSAIMERISREIKQAYSITSISANNLSFLTEGEGGALTKTVDFTLSGTNIRYLENGVFIDNLNPTNISINSVTFERPFVVSASLQTYPVKISLSISSTRDSLNRTYDFYDTVVMRGGY